ncbi:MAG: MFS transporter [Alcanivorax sp.]|nr:MFS transporter [Alcanivorax sp.]
MAKAPVTRHNAHTLAAGVVGNVVEWYDFALYGYLAPVFSSLFFPGGSNLTALLKTYGVFAAGFVMRPLGSMVFGYIGDRFGRKLTLYLSVILMTLPTFLLGCLPDYQSWGVAAPICLVLIRLIQGLSVGGEFSGSVTYVVETAPQGHRGVAGSLANFGSIVGMLLGAGAATLTTNIYDSAAVNDWAWRLPFLFGGILGLAMFLVRRNMPPSSMFHEHQKQHEDSSPLRQVLTNNRRELLVALLFASGYGVFFYLPLVYLPTWLESQTGMPIATALQINTVGTATLLVLVPLMGWVSDHLLRRRSLLLLAFGTTVVLAWPLFRLAMDGSWLAALSAQLIFCLLIAIPLGAAPATFVELFPLSDRLTGYSIAYNLGLGVVGGTAPMIAVWLIETSGHSLAPALYLSLQAAVSLLAAFALRDRSREPLLE